MISSEDKILNELIAVRAAAKQREEELSQMVEQSKSIFELNLRHETERIDRNYKVIVNEKEDQIRTYKGLLESKDAKILELLKRIEIFDDEKNLALREQRKSVLFSSELAALDLSQQRAETEKQRYTFEQLLKEKDEFIKSSVRQLDMLCEQLNILLNRERISLLASEEIVRELFTKAEVEEWALLQLLHTDFCSISVHNESKRKDELFYLVTSALTELNEGSNTDLNPSEFTLDFSSSFLRERIRTQLKRYHFEKASLENEITTQRCTIELFKSKCDTVEDAMTNISISTSQKIEQMGSQIKQMRGLQEQMVAQIARGRARGTLSSEMVNELSQTFEREISHLKEQNSNLTKQISGMVEQTKYHEALNHLSVVQQALRICRQDLEKISQTSHNKGNNSTLNVVESEIACEKTNVNSTEPVAINLPDASEDLPPINVESDEKQTEQITELRKELGDAKTTILDLKALLRKMKESTKSQEPSTPLTARPSETVFDSISASHPSEITPSPPPVLHNTQAESELHMQIFTLRRERDAWKRKADAALAQASHAEEQRLASVHTYLQLIGRKEEEYAHRILLGSLDGEEVPPPNVTNKEPSDSSLLPGDSKEPFSVSGTALDGVIQDVRVRGGQRAERWLAERAAELRSQAAQLNRTREELALKSSSLARREEALQHEKMGLLLKKGGARLSGHSLLMVGSPKESHLEPLRETTSASRLKPMLYAPLPRESQKAPHPQRFVLSNLSGASASGK